MHTADNDKNGTQPLVERAMKATASVSTSKLHFTRESRVNHA